MKKLFTPILIVGITIVAAKAVIVTALNIFFISLLFFHFLHNYYSKKKHHKGEFLIAKFNQFTLNLNEV